MKIVKSMCLIAAVALLISGCGSTKSNKTTESVYKPTLDASIEINGDTATLKLTTDLKLSREHYDQVRKEGEGHVHLSFDKGEKEILTEKVKVYEHVSKGQHEIKVSLHNNDHTPYDVSKTVTFEVK
ncbi:hypothetical protein GCM10008018_62010 [Paenibacillus marchantiophytorum]|uniref:YtkA-like domain-containing protein n=1 Tax=Paenibacillus marchantiophytorum TaxID=1619310 RepID=A0ABQ1FDN5_9BACL|nr:hypothetical protein [Paenibacillus marchantiophytorum]GGA07904.1 hypothetical protein GCM10008018_62010 [Paenibacillus marchantiophytorum]